MALMVHLGLSQGPLKFIKTSKKYIFFSTECPKKCIGFNSQRSVIGLKNSRHPYSQWYKTKPVVP